ncbi:MULTISPECIES: hypothetical protein [Bacillaceae]|uniref:Uncharacterized protein n=1 Tax=Metabacillus sediminis TaxID=3117746 RepID=A0ABZ2NGC2_9BACI|nr:hypothetical protein [Bacillus sp. SJS]KZZ83403.1 hypothetical protein AS29_016775 [Bacillus sp. SJS]
MLFRKKKKEAETQAIQQKLAKLEKSIQNLSAALSQLDSRPEPKSSSADSIMIRKTQAELGHTLSMLQNELSFIKNHLLAAGNSENPSEKTGQIPVVYIQNLHVEHVDMKEVDLSNNLGQLGIKELPGQLNIGTVYGKSKPAEKKNPKVYIQPKKD